MIPRSLALFALVAALTQGCAGASRTFYVDSRFSPEQETYIQNAADDWARAGAEPIDLVFGAKVDITVRGRNTIVNPGERAAMNTMEEFRRTDAKGNWTACANTSHGDPIKGVRIVLLPERMGDLSADDGVALHATTFASGIAHELGHYYIGSAHSSAPEDVMYFQSYQYRPTDNDVRALRRAME